MFKKSIMALAIATIAATSMSSAAFAKKHKSGWGHHHRGHYVRVYVPHRYKASCHYFKKKWQWTGKKYWYKKYKACLILKY